MLKYQTGCFGAPPSEATTAYSPSCSTRISGVLRTFPDFAPMVVSRITGRPLSSMPSVPPEVMNVSAFSLAQSDVLGSYSPINGMTGAYDGRNEAAPDSEFRLAEISVESYRDGVTTYTEVRIAGVPWPAYKLIALVVAALVLLVVGLATASAAAAVLGGAAAGTVVWLGLSVFSSPDA